MNVDSDNEPPPAHDTRSRFAPPDRWWNLAHLASLAVGGLYLLVTLRSQWFFLDEWDFLVRRGIFGAERGLFEPHNEHWSTAPILLYRVMFSIFGVRTYLPYAALLVAIHLGLCHLLYRLATRSGATPSVAFLIGMPLVVLGAGSENLLWAFQTTFVGSVALGVAALLLATAERPKTGVAVSLLLLSVMFSGVGVTMTAAVSFAALVTRGLRPAILMAAIPGAAYVAWLVGPGGEGLTTHETTIESIFVVPSYVWTGVASMFERFVGFPGGGAVVTAGVIVAVIVVAPNRAGRPVAVLAGAVVILFVINGLGRAEFGLAQATSGRYAYVGIAMASPLIAVALSLVVTSKPTAAVAVALAAIFAVVHNVGLLRADAEREQLREERSRATILAAASILERQRALDPNPEPNFAPDLDANDLRRLVESDQLPDGGSDPAGMAVARQNLLVAVDRIRRNDEAAPVTIRAGQGASTKSGNCLSIASSSPPVSLAIEPSGATIVRISASVGGTLSVRAEAFDTAVEPRRFTIDAGESFLHIGAEFAVTVDVDVAGSVEVCAPGAS